MEIPGQAPRRLKNPSARVDVRLPSKPTADLWSDLKWSSGRLTETRNKNLPLEVKEAPKRPGLYRMTWDGETDWSLVLKSLLVKSSLRVADRQLEFDDLPPPVLLTIGKTTNIHKRLREHFGTNPNNNRVVKRLGDLIPKPIYPACTVAKRRKSRRGGTIRD